MTVMVDNIFRCTMIENTVDGPKKDYYIKTEDE